MLPTFNMIGDWLVIEKFTMKLWPDGSKLRRGDVIVAVSPVKPTSIVTKRILGMPGDEILVDPTKSLTETIVVRRIVQAPFKCRLTKISIINCSGARRKSMASRR